MAKAVIRKQSERVRKVEWIERVVEDMLLLVLFLFTGLISIAVIGLLLFGQTTWMSRAAFVADTLKEHVIPWVVALALLVIGREIWLIRIYAENIQIGMELENLLKEVKRLELVTEKEEKEIEKLEKEVEPKKKKGR